MVNSPFNKNCPKILFDIDDTNVMCPVITSTGILSLWLKLLLIIKKVSICSSGWWLIINVSYYCCFADNIVNLTLSANHPVHPCLPNKCSAHAYTQNCARIHRESPEDAHARAQHRKITPNFADQWLRHSETQNTS